MTAKTRALKLDADFGSAVPLVLAGAWVLVTLAAASLQIAAVEQARWRAQASADVAALTLATTGDCGAARTVAEKNATNVEACTPPSARDPSSRVTVSAGIRWGLRLSQMGVPQRVSARARAGY